MRTRLKLLWLVWMILFTTGLSSCASPRLLPEGPTPIPTLIPVTEVASAIEPTPIPSPVVLSYPARLPSATEGQTIYNAYCDECHGVDGVGIVPGARNFRDLDYMRAETPTDFYLAVTEGRGEMPDYTSTLSSDERWDVVFYVWRLSTTADTLDTGQTIYGQNCVTCHGETGAGELLGASDLTDLRALADFTSQSLFLTITQGRGSMPAWQSLLSQDERWAVIDYVRSFTYDPTLSEEVVVAPTPSLPEEPTEVAGCSPDQNNPFAWDDADAIQVGEPIYQAQCAFCHGADGSGALPNAPDFTSPEVNAEFIGNPGVFFCSLTEGKASMPAYEDSLSVEERWQVLTYLASLLP